MKVELGRGERAFWMVLFAAVAAHLLAYVLLAYPAMPQTVPTHWGVDGTADGWDSKGSTVFMGAVLPLLVLALLFAVPFFDPRGRSFNRFKGIYQGFAAAMTLFMVVMGWMAPLTALGLLPEGGGISINVISFGFLGLLLVGLGVVMPRIEPNYTFGVRVPWTLADPENWRRTHRFAGPVFVVMGVVTLASALFSSTYPAVTLVALLGGTALVALYSFLLWKGAIR